MQYVQLTLSEKALIARLLRVAADHDAVPSQVAARAVDLADQIDDAVELAIA
jgi:hypothetical protein